MEDKLQSIDITQLPKASEVKSNDIMLLVRKNADGTVTPMKVDGSVLPSGGNGGASIRKKIKERYVLGRAIKPFSCQMGNERNWYVYNRDHYIVPINLIGWLTEGMVKAGNFTMNIWYALDGNRFGGTPTYSLRGLVHGVRTSAFGLIINVSSRDDGCYEGVGSIPRCKLFNDRAAYAYSVHSFDIEGSGTDKVTVNIKIYVRGLEDKVIKSESKNLIYENNRVRLNPTIFNRQYIYDLLRVSQVDGDRQLISLYAKSGFGIVGQKRTCRPNFRYRKTMPQDADITYKNKYRYLPNNDNGVHFGSRDSTSDSPFYSHLGRGIIGRYRFAFYKRGYERLKKTEWFNFYLRFGYNGYLYID